MGYHNSNQSHAINSIDTEDFNKEPYDINKNYEYYKEKKLRYKNKDQNNLVKNSFNFKQSMNIDDFVLLESKELKKDSFKKLFNTTNNNKIYTINEDINVSPGQKLKTNKAKK